MYGSVQTSCLCGCILNTLVITHLVVHLLIWLSHLLSCTQNMQSITGKMRSILLGRLKFSTEISSHIAIIPPIETHHFHLWTHALHPRIAHLVQTPQVHLLLARQNCLAEKLLGRLSAFACCPGNLTQKCFKTTMRNFFLVLNKTEERLIKSLCHFYSMKQNRLHHIFEVQNCKVNWPYSAVNLADSGSTGLVLARSWLCTSDLSCLGSCSRCFSVPITSSFLSVVWLSGKQGSEVEPLSTYDCQECCSL